MHDISIYSTSGRIIIGLIIVVSLLASAFLISDNVKRRDDD